MFIQSFLDLFNVHTSVRAPGSGISGLTLAILRIDMGRMPVFLKFVVKLPVSMGMSTSALLELFELATELHDMLPFQARGIVSHVVFLDIKATLLSFSQAAES
jgi:hypothetical protein